MLRISQEKEDQIHRMIAKGYTWERVAGVLGIGRTTVSRYLHPEHRRYPLKPRWTPRTPEEGKQVRKDRRRMGILKLTLNGKRRSYHVKKRPWPSACELCHRGKKIYGWHHWNNEHPEIGMWLCVTCHTFVEGLERGLDPSAYFKLKSKLTSEVEVEGI